MTKSEVKQIYKEKYIPKIKEDLEHDGVISFVGRRDCWNELLDMLLEMGKIHEEQHEDWYLYSEF